MKKQRARLSTQTTALLYALADVGPGGAAAETLAEKANLRTRQCAARLRWLQRGKLVRYVADGARWQLTDDSIFQGTK